MAVRVSVEEESPHTAEPEVTIIWPKHFHPPNPEASVHRASVQQAEETSKRNLEGDFDQPLNDTTAKLALRSKRTERLRRRLQRKEGRRVKSEIKSFLDLPPELLTEVLGHLLPTDLFTLLRLNQFSRQYVLDNEAAIASRVIQQRYWVLGQSFQLPMPLSMVEESARKSLLSTRWQERLKIHRNPYQHICGLDPTWVCSCMSCVLAWNNLNVILDLAHWQHDFENRQPIPIIPRGRSPAWNTKLLEKHAVIVKRAMESPISHARILQLHLDTITRTIVRNSKWRKKDEPKNTIKPRLYRLSDAEVALGTDEFLERSWPPSYQPIYMRDNYYSVEAFIPNRKWDKEEQVWKYYPKWPRSHLNDVAWVMARFSGTG